MVDIRLLIEYTIIILFFSIKYNVHEAYQIFDMPSKQHFYYKYISIVHNVYLHVNKDFTSHEGGATLSKKKMLDSLFRIFQISCKKKNKKKGVD